MFGRRMAEERGCKSVEQLLSSHWGRCGVRHGPRIGGCGNFRTGRTAGYVYREGGRPDPIHLRKACGLQFRGDVQSAQQLFTCAGAARA